MNKLPTVSRPQFPTVLHGNNTQYLGLRYGTSMVIVAAITAVDNGST